MRWFRIPYRKLVTLLAISFLLCADLEATVCVVLVTPRAIVIGTDSKGVVTTADMSLHKASIRNSDKIVQMAKGRILVATVGIADIKRQDGTVVYNFSDWVDGFHATPQTKVDDLGALLGKDVLRILNEEFAGQLQAGTLPPLNLSHDPSLPVVTYYIAKIENGTSRVIQVLIHIDWEKRIFEAPEIRVVFPNPNPAEPKNLFIQWNSRNGGGIDKLRTPNSATRELYLKAYPKEIGALFGDRALEPKDLVRLARILVSLEIVDSPESYSFPVLVYSLSKHHKAKRYNYQQ